MTKREKKRYSPPVVRRVKMEQAVGQSNCKTASPMADGMYGADSGDCNGVFGSPPPGTPCLNEGS